MNIHERIGTDYIARRGNEGEENFCFDRGGIEEFIVFVARGQADLDAQWELTDADGSTTYYTGEIQYYFVLQSHENNLSSYRLLYKQQVIPAPLLTHLKPSSPSMYPVALVEVVFISKAEAKTISRIVHLRILRQLILTGVSFTSLLHRPTHLCRQYSTSIAPHS